MEELTESYLRKKEEARGKRTFIYNLINNKVDDANYECWRESVFESSARFRSLFFEQKAAVMAKIDFFMNNKAWYNERGIPYTLGLGLHGEPGTGKTSFIKCLAQYTGRHIVSISFKLIKTKNQLYKVFHENVYNENNKRKKIGFSKKIIVLEDIDACGPIVLDRSYKPGICGGENDSIGQGTGTGTEEGISKMLTAVNKLVENGKEKGKDNLMKKACNTKKGDEDDPALTLDDILNLWDGIEENSGRMIVITSNYYEALDKALVRPGRIDITLELKKVNRCVLEDMIRHYYFFNGNNEEKEKEKEKEKEEDWIGLLERVPEYVYTPAQIMNHYMLYKDDVVGFLKSLSI